MFDTIDLECTADDCVTCDNTFCPFRDESGEHE